MMMLGMAWDVAGVLDTESGVEVMVIEYLVLDARGRNVT